MTPQDKEIFYVFDQLLKRLPTRNIFATYLIFLSFFYFALISSEEEITSSVLVEDMLSICVEMLSRTLALIRVIDTKTHKSSFAVLRN